MFLFCFGVSRLPVYNDRGLIHNYSSGFYPQSLTLPPTQVHKWRDDLHG